MTSWILTGLAFAWTAWGVVIVAACIAGTRADRETAQETRETAAQGSRRAS